jgi:hypothetical protein
MRFIKNFLLMVLASAFLVACGGGGGDPITGGGSTGASTNLNAVYDKLTRGMTYDQVKGLVGYAHNAGEQASSSGTNYKWSSGEGTATYCIMSVDIGGGGATSAIYVGSCDGTTKSRSRTL